MGKEFENEFLLFSKDIYNKVFKFVGENINDFNKTFESVFLKLLDGRRIEVSFDENDYFLRIENNKFLPTLENGKLVEKQFGDSFFIGNTKYYGFSAKYELFNCKDGKSLSYQIGDEKYVAKTQINDEDIPVIKQYMEKLSSQIDSLAYDDEKNYSSSSLNSRNR